MVLGWKGIYFSSSSILLQTGSDRQFGALQRTDRHNAPAHKEKILLQGRLKSVKDGFGLGGLHVGLKWSMMEEVCSDSQFRLGTAFT